MRCRFSRSNLHNKQHHRPHVVMTQGRPGACATHAPDFDLAPCPPAWPMSTWPQQTHRPAKYPRPAHLCSFSKSSSASVCSTAVLANSSCGEGDPLDEAASAVRPALALKLRHLRLRVCAHGACRTGACVRRKQVGWCVVCNLPRWVAAAHGFEPATPRPTRLPALLLACREPRATHGALRPRGYAWC